MGVALLTKLAEGRQDSRRMKRESANASEPGTLQTPGAESWLDQEPDRGHGSSAGEVGNVADSAHADRARGVWQRLDPSLAAPAEERLQATGADVGAPKRVKEAEHLHEPQEEPRVED
jgi:hypothetical protein